jgi:hypothetical protein
MKRNCPRLISSAIFVCCFFKNSKNKMEDERGKERKTQIDIIIRCLTSVGDPGNTTNWLQHDRCATFGVTRALPSDSLRSRNRQFGFTCEIYRKSFRRLVTDYSRQEFCEILQLPMNQPQIKRHPVKIICIR